MHYSEVAENVTSLVRNLPEQSEFIYAFLEAYGTPQANVTRLKSGTMNLAKLEGDLLFKKKLYFKPTEGDLFAALDALKSDKATLSNDPRFLLVTDFQHLVALDRKMDDTLDCKLTDLPSHFDFFLPLAGLEKTKLSNESEADINAAERMAKLFDAIRSHNPEFVEANSHAMNVFLARLLFCFYAEDTGIFPEENAISNAIASHTAADGSDLHDFFVRLFDILDRKSRAGLPQHLQSLPYVNGGLFREHFPIPEFSMKARRMMLEAGELSWADINPDIFGSMFQAVIDPEERHNLGQHYTSVTNIMKVIEPLFLNDFREAFEKACSLQRGQSQALHRLLERIAKVKIFDPACGSGNFLIIAYKELRRLEMDIFQELQRTTGELPLSGLQVSQFYGIEIADFAAETAVLALWLTEHQMNLESKRVCGQAPDNLPLRDGASIKCANACRIDWESVCPKEDGDEIYILGNPPYLGGKKLRLEQSRDMDLVGLAKMKQLDYIGCWFIKASKFIKNSKIRFAFVTTSSICQGEQVHLMWSLIFDLNQKIIFAYKPFAWTNNAKGQAGVYCTILGISESENAPQECWIYNHTNKVRVSNVCPYLIEGPSIFVKPESKTINQLPKMCMGSNPVDGKNLVLSKTEFENICHEYPQALPFLRRYMGGNDFMSDIKRYCIWVNELDLHRALEIPPLLERINKCKEYRLTAGRDAKKVAHLPHRFCYRTHKDGPAIIFPNTSSSNRLYIPGGFIFDNAVINHAAFAIYNSAPYVLGLLLSSMHRIWLATVGGRLGDGFRYSVKLVYNTFPVPNLSATRQQELTTQVMNVLQERENHPEKTMAQLYDPDKMPAGLRAAHQALDRTVDRLYRKTPFTSDEERLEHLFKRYEAMIAKEQKGKK